MAETLKYGMVGGELKALIGECSQESTCSGPESRAGMRMFFRN